MNGINGLTSTMNILNAAGIEAVGTHLSDPGTTGGYVIRKSTASRSPSSPLPRA